MNDGPPETLPALSETDIDGIERDMLDQEHAGALIAAGIGASAAFEQASREQEAARLAKHLGEPAQHSIQKRALELARKGVHPSVALRGPARAQPPRALTTTRAAIVEYWTSSVKADSDSMPRSFSLEEAAGPATGLSVRA